MENSRRQPHQCLDALTSEMASSDTASPSAKHKGLFLHTYDLWRTMCFRKFHLSVFYSLLQHLTPSKACKPVRDREMFDLMAIDGVISVRNELSLLVLKFTIIIIVGI